MRHARRIIATVLGGLAIGLTGCGTEVDSATGILLAMTPSSQSGGISVQLTRAARAAQALPDNTDSVTITVSGGALRAPVSKTITSDQFINNQAQLSIDKLPPGEIQIDAVVYDTQGNSISMGGAKATIKVGQITAVALNLVTKGATGGAAVTVDSTVIYDDPVLSVPPQPIGTQTMLVAPPADSLTCPGWLKAVHLVRLQAVKLSVSDRMAYRTYFDFTYNYFDAAGFVSASFTGALDGGQPALALLGRFVPDDGTDAQRFLVGKSGVFKAAADGTLYLGANTWLKKLSPSSFVGDFSVTMTDVK